MISLNLIQHLHVQLLKYEHLKFLAVLKYEPNLKIGRTQHVVGRFKGDSARHCEIQTVFQDSIIDYGFV